MARKLRAPRATPEEKAQAKAAKTASIGSNVTDATIIEFTNKAIAAHADFEEKQAEAKKAQALYRATLKDAKKAGVDQDSIIWLIASRKREPGDIDRETRNRNRIAKLMQLPIGTQLGLLDDGTTVATAVDDAKQAEQADNSYFDGYEAGKLGKPHSSCEHAEGTQQRESWLDGWGKAQAELVNQGAAA